MDPIRESQKKHSPIVGEPGLTCALQESNDFVNWTAVTNLLNAGGTIEFEDGRTGVSRRCYRAAVVF